MSRKTMDNQITELRFPRPRGDEPVTQAVARDVLGFSPPARG